MQCSYYSLDMGLGTSSNYLEFGLQLLVNDYSVHLFVVKNIVEMVNCY